LDELRVSGERVRKIGTSIEDSKTDTLAGSPFPELLKPRLD
jgi:hypothetical protein